MSDVIALVIVPISEAPGTKMTPQVPVLRETMVITLLSEKF